MRGYVVFGSRLAGAGMLLGVTLASAIGGEVSIARTNWVERWITNVIEVRMPTNRFVDEFHTNWVTQVRTNTVIIYATNWVTQTVTNTVRIDAFRTNVVQAYAQVPSRAAVAPDQPSQPPAESAASPSLLIEAARTGPAGDVQLKVKWVAEGSSAPLVQQWQVQSEDGAFLAFAQSAEFKRELSNGRYKVTVKVQRASQGPTVTAVRTLIVTPTSAVVEPRATKR